MYAQGKVVKAIIIYRNKISKMIKNNFLSNFAVIFTLAMCIESITTM